MIKRIILSLLISNWILNPSLLARNNTSLISNKNVSTYIIEIRGAIDLGLSSFVERVLKEAKKNNIKYIILDIDTVGGRLDAALDIGKLLLEAKPIHTIAFISGNAWSAGALISLACEKIFMTPVASIGSAEPRQINSGLNSELVDEKTVSAVRTKFKAIAEANRHPVNLALAMVDKDYQLKKVLIRGKTHILTDMEIEELKTNFKEEDYQIIKTINPKGKLLNLISSEAKELGLIEEIIANKEKLLEYLGIDSEDTVSLETNWSEKLVRFITHPLISPWLFTLGFLALIFELKTPGWGITGSLGLIFLALFFWGHYLAGLANWTEILIFITGIILIFLEIFMTPGFGILGALGIIFLIIGLFLSLIKFPLVLPLIQIREAFFTLGLSLVLILLIGILLLRIIPKTKLWKKITLFTSEKKDLGFASQDIKRAYVGEVGRTITILRPVGKIKLEKGEIIEAISEGEFIDKDKEVVIVKISENKIFVREKVN